MTSKKKPHTKVDDLKEAIKKRKELEEKGAQNTETASADDFGELSDQLRAAEEEAKAHYDKMLRVMAELDNYKKRSEREKQDLVKFSNEKLIKDLLPVLDDLDRVLEHVPQGASQELLDFVNGVKLVNKHFVGTLEKFGLQTIHTKDEKFNPELHEAVAHVPSENVEQDYIVDEHRKGYILNGRVVRAAMVTVSKGRLQ